MNKKKRTNLDQVREMTPEQFATWMVKQITTSLFVGCPFDSEERLKNEWLRWLNEEVKE